MVPSSPDRPGTARVSRRRFLAGVAGAGVAAGAFGTGAAVVHSRSVRIPAPDPTAGTGRLSGNEMATILALLEVLVPDHLLPPPAMRAAIIDEATLELPGLHREYASAARALDALADDGSGRRFAEITLATRIEVIDGLFWRYGSSAGLEDRVRRKLELMVHSEPQRRLRHVAAKDLMIRFHGGALVRYTGYANHPGLPGDPREYTRPPETGRAAPVTHPAGRLLERRIHREARLG